MRNVVAALVVACASSSASMVRAQAFKQPLFDHARGSPLVVPGDPSVARVGDFNEDGKTDLLVVHSKPPAASLLPGDGTGRFAPGRMVSLPFAPGEVVVADLDGDRHLDVAGLSHDSYDVLLLRGNRKGELSTAPSVASMKGDHPHGHGLLCAEVNGDRRPDLLVVHSDPDNALAVLLNQGDLRFSPAESSPLPLGPAPYPATVADLDNDGDLDVAAPSTQDERPSLSILFNNGRGQFTPAPEPVRVKTGRPFYVAAGDIDRDGDADLLVTHDDATRLTILTNDGRGGFAERADSPFLIGGPAWGVLISDFNKDGYTDFATAGDASVRVFLGSDRGAFSAAPGSPYSVPKGSWRLSIADVNGDGKHDLITCGVEDRRITILLGR